MRFSPGVRYWRLGVLPMVLLGAMLVSACEKPDASYLTSPSADLLIGTTTGNVAFLPPETAPDPVASPAGWDERLELALFGELEDGSAALRIVLTMKSQAGKGFEVWLSNAQGTVARWSGGSSKPYNGVVCFQMPMTAKVKDKATGVTHAEAMNLPPGLYTATVVFRDVETGVFAAKALKVTGNVPQLKGEAPGPDSKVFRNLLGCPRGS